MKSLVVARNSFNLANCAGFTNGLIIPTVLAIGFALRLIGIKVGLPDSPDPREVLIAQDVLNLIHFTAPPQIYNWPGTAWFYVIAAVGKLLSLSGLPLTEARVILLARGINVLLSTATLWFTYRVGVHCYSRRVGQIAAGLLAVAMLHATNESRFALVDIPATFCVMLFLWLVAGARSSAAGPTYRAVVWLGIIAGIGFAVKFTTVFVGFSLLVFRRREGFYKKLTTLIGVSILTFTFLCPYWLIDLVSPAWNLFFEDFWYEATHYHQGHFGLIAAAESGGLHRFIYLWTLLKWGMGLPLALLASLGVLCSLVSIKKFPASGRLLLAFVIPYLLFIGIHKVKFARHLLVLYPVLTVLAAAALERVPSLVGDLFRFIRPREATKSRHPTAGLPSSLKTFRKGFGGVVGLYSFVYTVSFATVLLSQSTKIAASDWIAVHIPPEESVAIAPEVLFEWLLPELTFAVTDEEVKWVLILVPNLEVFRKYQAFPHRYQDEDWYPLREIEFEKTLAFYERVLGNGSRYELHKTFRCPPKFLGMPIISDSGAPFPMRALAHPELRIYRRFN